MVRPSPPATIRGWSRIPELVLLTLVVAMGVGWAQETRHRGPENTRLREQNRKLEEMRLHWLAANQ